MANEALPILDCHQHFIDARRLTYPVFAQRSAGFEALVGDYAALPRVYLPQDYARDVAGLNVVATVGAEFIADDAPAELRWLSGLGAAGGHPDALIAPVDFQSPDLADRLDLWASLGRVRAVRQHLAWHPTNPLLRYASRPDLLADPDWRRGLARLRGRGLVCELELFSTQLPQLAAVAAAFPEIDFVLPVMGWPVDVSDAGRAAWRQALASVAACANVRLKLFGLECVFGIHWTVAQTRPWLLDAIDLFGPPRCMFASHLPICRLAGGVQRLYAAYFEVIAGFSRDEQRQLLHDTAAATYHLPQP